MSTPTTHTGIARRPIGDVSGRYALQIDLLTNRCTCAVSYDNIAFALSARTCARQRDNKAVGVSTSGQGLSRSHNRHMRV